METLAQVQKGLKMENTVDVVKDTILVGKNLMTPESGQAIINEPSLYNDAIQGKFSIGTYLKAQFACSVGTVMVLVFRRIIFSRSGRKTSPFLSRILGEIVG